MTADLLYGGPASHVTYENRRSHSVIMITRSRIESLSMTLVYPTWGNTVEVTVPNGHIEWELRR
jgi:hypothetical protein